MLDCHQVSFYCLLLVVQLTDALESLDVPGTGEVEPPQEHEDHRQYTRGYQQQVVQVSDDADDASKVQHDLTTRTTHDDPNAAEALVKFYQ